MCQANGPAKTDHPFASAAQHRRGSAALPSLSRDGSGKARALVSVASAGTTQPTETIGCLGTQLLVSKQDAVLDGLLIAS